MGQKKLIVIAGPTASGKTALAIELATHLQTEILSADSRQCYKELAIGVAKPSAEQLKKVKHYFIDSHSIHENVSAGEYERYGLDALQQIFSKSDYAICVGGTGLYIQALCNGIDEMPEVDMNLFLQAENNFKEKGMTWLQEEIKLMDPEYYKFGEIKNPSRILRALTFILSQKQSILTFQTKKNKVRDFQTIYYAIETNRDQLYKQINQRVDDMLRQGLVEEVRNLAPYKNLKSLNTVGYKELFLYFDGLYTSAESIEKIKQHSRNYAKRQITWFKNQGNYQFSTTQSIAFSVMNNPI